MARGKFGAVVGLLAGAALGVLFAPKKGKELRKTIKDEVDKGGSGIESVKKAFKHMGDDIVSSCKDCCECKEVEEVIEKGKGKAGKIAKKVIKKAHTGLDKAEEKVQKKLKKK